MFELEDRKEHLFGRAQDIVRLRERLRFVGITVLVGRAQMGKSWLLMELAHQLATQADQKYLVGFTRQYGQEADLMKRAVVDLYERWLSEASAWQLLRRLWDQQKGTALSGITKSFASVISEVSKVAGQLVDPGVTAIGVAVETAVDGIIGSVNSLEKGPIQVPKLHYEQARDLVCDLTRLTKRPVALFLDQWEQSPNPVAEMATLKAILDNPAEWPYCHLYLAFQHHTGTPTTDSAWRQFRELKQGYPGYCSIHELKEMALDDPDERQRCVSYLRREVPAAAHTEDDALLKMVGGFPAVISRWTGPLRGSLTTPAELRALAEDAQAYRFREVEGIAEKLLGPAQTLALRLALVPATAATEVWLQLKPHILHNLDETGLEELFRLGFLESIDPPHFGHTKRLATVRRYFARQNTISMRKQLEQLATSFASGVHHLAPAEAVPAAALRNLMPLADIVKVSPLTICLMLAAESLFGEPNQGRLSPTLVRDVLPFPPSVAGLVSVGLYNSLTNTAIDDKQGVIEQLRRVYTSNQGNGLVRKAFAQGLFFCVALICVMSRIGSIEKIPFSKSFSCYLDELRLMASEHSEDVEVATQLLSALMNAANLVSDTATRSALVEECEALVTRLQELERR